MSKVKLVIFDIAGTIIEDNGEVIDAFCTALGKNGLPSTEAELKEFKGASKREVIARFVARQRGQDTGNAALISRTYEDFQADLEGRFSDGRVKPILGAADTFTWLNAHNILFATTTGFFRSVTDLILNSVGWQDLLAANVCSDDVRHGRPAPYMIFHAMEAAGIDDVRQVLNVGDTPLDIQAGHRAGVLGAIGVLTGIHKGDRLGKELPTHLIASVADLPSLIESQYAGEISHQAMQYSSEQIERCGQGR